MFDEYIFYIEMQKGNALKGLVDILSAQLSRVTFTVDNDGIRILETGGLNSICYYVELERENFKKFKCNKPISFSFGLKHVNKLIRSIKKKDSVILFALKEPPLGLAIQIFSDASSRKETNTIVIQEEILGLSESLPSKDLYFYPIPITASDFQKIKKQTILGNKITNVRMFEDSYLSFSCGTGHVFSSQLEFGEHPDSDEMYDKEFNASLFSNLVKLSSFTNQIQFYCPMEEDLPIHIRSKVADLGHIDIYIKDNEQLSEATP